MAQEKSGLLSAMGTMFQILKAIIDEVLSLGGNDENVRRILSDQNLRREIGKLIMSASKSFVVASFRVAVDYGRTLKSMVDAGKYDWVNEDITQEHFPVSSQGGDEVSIFHFNEEIASENAILAMDREGFRPARIEELLALGEKQPELQKQFPIIALGSIWLDPGGDRCVAYLDFDGSERLLCLDWFDDSWSRDCRFAAVRK